MALSPKESAEFIASRSRNVGIEMSGIEKLGDFLADELSSGKFSASSFSQVEFHPSPKDPWALDWIFLIDTLNFCFWHLEDATTWWTVEGQSGYFALCAALNRTVRNKPQFLNPSYYSTITEDELRIILKGDNDAEVPLLTERVKCLHEVGNVLLQKYDGSFEKLIIQADKSAEKLLNLIVTNFSCYRDEAIYQGKRVAFYKRAQILVGDIWACFENKGIGHLADIDKITMFADYRVPQTLIFFGCLIYKDELLKRLNMNEILKNGDADEVEIRACSIQAVELIKKYVQDKLPNHCINSIVIDHFLWDYRRKHAKEILKLKIPFHKTLSIYY